MKLSGNVYHDRDDDGNFDRRHRRGHRRRRAEAARRATATTRACGPRPTPAGFYKFTNLRGRHVHGRRSSPGRLARRQGHARQPAAAWPTFRRRATRSARSRSTGARRASNTTSANCCPARSAAASTPTTAPTATSTIRTSCSKACRSTCSTRNGNVIATTYTNADGEYAFTGLRARHVQRPRASADEYFDGGERVGTLGGSKHDVGRACTASSPASTSAPISTAIQYDFCEKPPASISGRVHADEHEDCDFDDPEILLEGVVDRLARRATATSSPRRPPTPNGEYRFDGLRAGDYQVHEHPADRLLRRRRARRHRRAARATASTRSTAFTSTAGRRCHPVRLLREGRRHALGQRLSRPRRTTASSIAGHRKKASPASC